jgi:hypothetical protein
LTIQSGALDNLVKEKSIEVVQGRVDKLLQEKSNGSPAVGHRVIESKDL